MITKDQFCEALQVKLIQDNLHLLEKYPRRFSKGNRTIIKKSEEVLQKLTGNRRGFLDDGPL
jgi:hypothetical protein